MSLSAIILFRSYKSTVETLTLCLDEEIPLSNNILFKFFHCVVVLGAVSLDHVDFSEGTSSNHLNEFKVAQTYFFVGTEQVFASLIFLFYRRSGITGINHLIRGLTHDVYFFYTFPISAFVVPQRHLYWPKVFRSKNWTTYMPRLNPLSKRNFPSLFFTTRNTN